MSGYNQGAKGTVCVGGHAGTSGNSRWACGPYQASNGMAGAGSAQGGAQLALATTGAGGPFRRRRIRRPAIRYTDILNDRFHSSHQAYLQASHPAQQGPAPTGMAGICHSGSCQTALVQARPWVPNLPHSVGQQDQLEQPCAAPTGVPETQTSHTTSKQDVGTLDQEGADVLLSLGNASAGRQDMQPLEEPTKHQPDTRADLRTAPSLAAAGTDDADTAKADAQAMTEMHKSEEQGGHGPQNQEFPMKSTGLGIMGAPPAQGQQFSLSQAVARIQMVGISMGYVVRDVQLEAFNSN